MLRLLTWTVVLAAFGAISTYGYQSLRQYYERSQRVEFRTDEVVTGDLRSFVTSTGEVKPVLSVAVGSFVSGPITKLHVDFNDRVEEGQLLAEIDPRIYDSAVARDQASLSTRLAEVERVKAQLEQARNDERRANGLRAESADYISQAEVDRFHFGRMGLEAQLKVAEASVLQARATLENSEANLAYTHIVSPVAGIVIDRKIDPGQTLAAQFQAPELFIIAPEMEEKMHIFASVDEADIGLLRKSYETGRPVEFTIEAYPEETFTGQIEQIRFASVSEQNVVTYPVVVAAPNPDLRLLPGMTASLSFEVEKREGTLKLPNAALRFFPDVKTVRDEDQWLITGEAKAEKDAKGSETNSGEEDSEEIEQEAADSTDEDTVIADIETDNEAATSDEDSGESEDDVRHVWVKMTGSDGMLRAIEIRTGISDSKFTEVLEGDIEAGDAVVVGVEAA